MELAVTAAPAIAPVPTLRGHRLDELEFQPIPHAYFLRGRELPSVTNLMRENGIGFQGFAPQEALDRGNFCHEASVLIDGNELDWSTVPQDWEGYCRAYERAIREQPVKVVAAERRLFDPGLGVAGTLDRTVIRNAMRMIREIKTGDASDVDVQIAAYARLWNLWFPNEPVNQDVGELLKLNDDGSYRLTDVNLRDGHQDFIACVRLSARRRKHGRPRLVTR